MQVLWRPWNVMSLRSAVSQLTERVSAATIISMKYCCEFHSTSSSSEKWKTKFDSDAGGKPQQPKDYIRYSVRQRRSDTRKALKSILYRGCTPTSMAQIGENDVDQLHKKYGLKSTHKSRRAKNLVHKKQRLDDSEGDCETAFDPFFGMRGFSWTFRASEKQYSWEKFSQWDYSTNSRIGIHLNDGSCVDRATLGLPRAGPLKIEDVKAAFRQSALKWHPDKHHGPSQVVAEEKFKKCVDAYKSLCNAVSSP